jgi:PhnB protein
MRLEPYIFFYGRCEEALAFYKSVLNGDYELQRVGGSPAAEHMPPGSENRVMHASFRAGDMRFMASDGREEKSVDPDAGNISLSIETDDTAAGDRIFNALAEGGKVSMPMDAAFWGGRFGMLVDRFGIEWMVTSP